MKFVTVVLKIRGKIAILGYHCDTFSGKRYTAVANTQQSRSRFFVEEEKVDRLFFDKEEDYVPEDVEEEDEGDDATPVDVRDDRCHYEG